MGVFTLILRPQFHPQCNPPCHCDQWWPRWIMTDSTAVRNALRSLITSSSRPPDLRRLFATKQMLWVNTKRIFALDRMFRLGEIKIQTKGCRHGQANDARHKERHRPRAWMPTDLRPDGEYVLLRSLHDCQRGKKLHSMEKQKLWLLQCFVWIFFYQLKTF